MARLPAPALSSGAPPGGGRGGANLSAAMPSRGVGRRSEPLTGRTGPYNRKAGARICLTCSSSRRVPLTAPPGPVKGDRNRLLGSFLLVALVGDYRGLFRGRSMMSGRDPDGRAPSAPSALGQRPGGERPLISSCISRRKPEKTAHLSPERVTKRRGRQAHRTGPRGPKRSPASARTLRGHDRHLM